MHAIAITKPISLLLTNHNTLQVFNSVDILQTVTSLSIHLYSPSRPMHIMLLILPHVLCSDSLPLTLLCLKILPIMPHYALKISLKIDTNGHCSTAVNTVEPPLSPKMRAPPSTGQLYLKL